MSWCADCGFVHCTCGSIKLFPEKGEITVSYELKCSYCNGTGKHLCPDVAEPILIDCTKKGCEYAKKPKGGVDE